MTTKVHEHPAGLSAGTNIPSVTTFAFARLLNPAPETKCLSLTAEGHLMVTIRGEMMVRPDALLLQTDNLEEHALNRRMQGRTVPQVFSRLLSIEGEGYLVLSREREHFYPLLLQRDLCFFAEKYLWALEAGLMWDVGLLPGSRRTNPLALIRTAGEGAVALRVPGGLVAVKITPDRPYRVRDVTMVGWVGNVIPRVSEDPSIIRCEGEGAILINLPGGAVASQGDG